MCSYQKVQAKEVEHGKTEIKKVLGMRCGFSC